MPSIEMLRPITDGSALELARPGVVPDDGHQRGPGRVLRRLEPAAERWPEPQHGQIGRRGVFGDRRPQDALVKVVHAARNEYGGRVREDLRVSRHVEVRGVRVPVDAPRVGSPLIDVDQTLWLDKRHGAKDRRVDEAEDRGSGADAQAENQEGRRREAPVAAETAEGVAGVAQEHVDGPCDWSIAGRMPELLDNA